MSGDYTRFTFDPRDDHAGVLMQQGRVMLDADWNEFVELLDRRWRSETIDIIGKCTVPKETPFGFLIGASGGTLSIGRGRIYVDGLQAENHGAPPLEFDRILAESRGTTDLLYTTQPSPPSPLPPLPTTGTHIVYLDVWEREVTHIEDAELIEKAVGVDSAARLQTVWQVRVLEVQQDRDTPLTCASVVPEWDALVRGAAGRITLDAAGVPAIDDPCIIPPNGGYRGTENRLYRVEIHDGGDLGAATFKWSRDNASNAAVVTAIDGTGITLTVSHTGRDEPSRFASGDWVEVTDDAHEFAGLAGVMAKVLSVDPVLSQITLTAALAEPFDLSRHTRVRRWDHKGLVRDLTNAVVADVDASGGVIPITAGTTYVLENGVHVTFTLADPAGVFRPMDYWVSPARTVDASVVPLLNEPPRGVHHHFCRLAIAAFTATGPDPKSILDCRTLWPPDVGEDGCECTVCVSPESHASGAMTIQHAVDIAKQTGGTVCLGPGTYILSQTLSLAGAQSVRVRGHGWKTLVIGFGLTPMVDVSGAIGVVIEEMWLLSVGLVKGGTDFVATHLSASGLTPVSGDVVFVANSMGVTIQRNVIAEIALRQTDLFARCVALEGVVAGVQIRENILLGGIGVGATALVPKSPEFTDIFTANPLATFGVDVADNAISARSRGVSFDGAVLHFGATRIRGNSIAGSSAGSVVDTAWTFSLGAFAASHVDVSENTVVLSGAGLVLGADNLTVRENEIAGTANVTTAPSTQTAIALVDGLDVDGIDRCLVVGNRISHLAGTAIGVSTLVRSGMIKQNAIEDVTFGIVMHDGSGGNTLSIENNHLLRVGDGRGIEKTRISAIEVRGLASVEIASNTIDGVGQGAAASPERVGIVVDGVQSSRIAGNDITDLAPEPGIGGAAAGILVSGAFERVDITDNTVRRSRSAIDKASDDRWWALRFVGKLTFVPIGASLGALPFTRGFTFTFGNFVFAADRNAVTVLPRGRGIAAVRGNLFDAFGSAPSVEIAADGVCMMTENRVLLATSKVRSVVDLTAGAAVFGNNYVEGPSDGKTPSVTLVVPAPAGAIGPFTVVGNLTSGPIEMNGAALPAQWLAVNTVAV